MTEPALPAEFLELLESVEAKRPRTVIDHILAHGYVTTEDLKERHIYRAPCDAADLQIDHRIPFAKSQETPGKQTKT